MVQQPKLEHLILNGLFTRPDYLFKVLPYLKPEYFQNMCDRAIFTKVKSFVAQYTTNPTPEAIGVDLERDDQLSDDAYAETVQNLNFVSGLRDKSDTTWLIDETEQFCRDRAIEIAILDSIQIIKGKDKERRREVIPEMLTKALGISFDPKLGLDLKEDFGKLWHIYRERFGERVPFGLAKLDDASGGGMPKGTLTSLLAQSNLGKSLAMVSIGCNAVMMGKKVGYISFEMDDYMVAQRAQSNLSGIPIKSILELEEADYAAKMERIFSNLPGVFKVKRYPTAGGSVSDLNHLLDEWKIKQGFVPDLICVDYINIMTSSRVITDNTYFLVKAIAEELRGFAGERNVAVLTATQTTRGGFDAPLLTFKDVAESKALIDTVDLLIAMTLPKEMKRENMILMQMLKNRLGDATNNDVFAVGVNRAQQKLYDLKTEPRLVQDRELFETQPKKRRTLG